MGRSTSIFPKALVNAFWERNGPLVLVHRTEKDEIQLRQAKPEFSCFLKTEHVDRELRRMLTGSRSVLGITEEGSWLRVRWRDRNVLRQVCAADGWFASRGIQTYEGDLHPVRRFMIDNEVSIQRPRRVWLDIEVDSRLPIVKQIAGESRVLCWALVGEDGWWCTGTLVEDSNEAEADLLEELWEQLERFDQVCAWNGEGYDYPVIKARSELLNVKPRHHQRWLWVDHLQVFRRMNVMAAESGEEKQSYSLENVCQAVLGYGKVDFDSSKTWQSWLDDPDSLEHYCLHDTKLMFDLESKTGYLDLHFTICEATGIIPNEHGGNPSIQVDSFMLKLAKSRDAHFITADKHDDSRFLGAYVMQPTARGIVKDVHVADFSRLYPSIILSWNMSPDTKAPRPPTPNTPSYYGKEVHARAMAKWNERPEGVCRSAIGVDFHNQPTGLLPTALETLLEMRKEWSKKQAAAPPGTTEWKEAGRRSTAYKIAANSFYGVIGQSNSRYFDKQIAESVTQCGAWLIKQTIEAAREWGIEVIYCDTDSIFAIGVTRARFEEFVKWCNDELYPRLLKESGCERNFIELDYEKQFSRIVFVSAKRYIGKYKHYKGTEATADSKPEIKGIEYKRGDTCRLARNMQEIIINDLCDGIESVEHFVELTTKWQKRVLEEPVTVEDVQVSKRLSRPLSGYAVRKKNNGDDFKQPPFVRVAKMLKKRGEYITESVKIDYFVKDKPTDTVLPSCDWDGDCDRFHLWENQVWKPSQRLLENAFPEHDWAQYHKVRPKKTRRATKQTSVNASFKGLERRSKRKNKNVETDDDTPQAALFE